jgi:hypothetical protein
MKYTILSLALVTALAGGGSLLAGCREKGPAEKIGEQIDEATEEAKEKAEEAGKRVEKAVDDLTK